MSNILSQSFYQNGLEAICIIFKLKLFYFGSMTVSENCFLFFVFIF